MGFLSRIKGKVSSWALSQLDSRVASLIEERNQLQALANQYMIQRDSYKAASDKWASRGAPDYDADKLSTWGKVVSFMQDERFLRAYRRGMDSGHKIGRSKGSSQDVHIEWRIAVCCWAGWHAKHLDGDFVECGTNTGIMSLAVCDYVGFNATGKNFYLFDTFSGIPEDQISATEQALGRASENAMYEECFETAKNNFSAFPKATLIRGKVPETLGRADISKVAYLCIDMNIAYPERAAIEYFWPKMAPGAVTIFDDYAWKAYINQKLALDEFAASKGVEILTLPTGQGLLLHP